jgi:flagellar motor switch protein FliN/FliY
MAGAVGQEWNPMASESEPFNPDDIEQLLKQAQDAGAAATPPMAPLSGLPPANPVAAAAALNQNEIESLLQGVTGKTPGNAPLGAAPAAGSDAENLARRQAALRAAGERRAAAPDSGPAQGDIEYLLRQAEEALASVNAPVNPVPSLPVSPFKLQDFTGAPPSTDAATLDLIRDVELNLKIELGRTHMYLEDVLKLRKGTVVPLDKLAGDPVDIYVNGRLIARGEVLVLNDNFAVRVAELVASDSTG